MFERGLIYRGVRMVNWDPKAKTAISDEEVIHKEQNSIQVYVAVEPGEEAKNSIEKSLYTTPQGMPPNVEPDLAIEIEDPEKVTVSTPGVEIVFDPTKDSDGTGINEFSANLADYMGEDELADLSSTLLEQFQSDKN